jgi:nitroreductase
MNVYEAIEKRRSVRKFLQKPIPYSVLRKLINAARLAPSGGNFQAWEFIVVDDKELCAKIFPMTSWAIYFGKEGAPEEGERPVSYVVFLNNKSLNKNLPPSVWIADISAAIENLILAAVEEGIGTCWLGSMQLNKIQRANLVNLLSVPDTHSLEFMVALGYPVETHQVEDIEKDGSIKYYRDEQGIHHVPKRKLEHILHRNGF